MKKPADARSWFPLYVRDWDADTAHLSCEEDGAYGRLIRFYWHNGAPPDSDAALARIVREPPSKWKRLRPILSPFFVIVGGRWTHKRVEAERVKAEGMVARQLVATKAAADARWNARRTRDQVKSGCVTECETDASRNASRNAPTPTHSPLSGREEEEPSQDELSSAVVPFSRGGRS